MGGLGRLNTGQGPQYSICTWPVLDLSMPYLEASLAGDISVVNYKGEQIAKFLNFVHVSGEV